MLKKSNICLEKKKIVQRGSPEKKIPAQAVSEKKNRASWKFPKKGKGFLSTGEG